MREASIQQLAYIYNLHDFEELLQNARNVDDKTSVIRLMIERNEFIAAQALVDDSKSHVV